MTSESDLRDLAERVAERMLASQRRLVSAESCTGGWVAKVCTDLPGSSRWFEGGFVTYSNAAKVRDLGVSSRTLEMHGAVSEPVVLEMARGALRVSGADLAVSVSGIAGPDGGSVEKPVGTVWLAVGRRDAEARAELQRFSGDRENIRRSSVARALQLLLGA
ncbi:MAG TPA: nicotinamide-nucleotide amidohydrolase family protein [Steroidobacteraceae bacterium]|nr:nicotinamide-nucleotide amidohydrolase family protein [Steroidobacteraceae bacterium]